jgi:hypothetical protein
MSYVQEYYQKEFNKLLTGFLENAAINPSTDVDELLQAFNVTLQSVINKITEIKRQNPVDYDVVPNIMRLLESNVILNSQINEERKYLMMEYLESYNDSILDKMSKKLKRANSVEIFRDMVTSIEEDIKNQTLFNKEYETSIKERRLTPGLFELLKTYKRHNSELVDHMEDQARKNMVQMWMNLDSRTFSTPVERDMERISLMNEVDGGRRKSKTKRHHKKSKSKSKSKYTKYTTNKKIK